MNELTLIASRYDNGELDYLKDDLFRFLATNKKSIRAYQQQMSARTGKNIDDSTAVKIFLLKVRSVNPIRDMQDQTKQMATDKIRFQQNGSKNISDEDFARIWAEQFSPIWRSERVTTLIYVFERNKHFFLKALD